MKKFKNNNSTAYAWANATHIEGEGHNIFFYFDKIYSYGKHYQIAERVETLNGPTLYFVNTNGYSNSTAKHTNHVISQIDTRNALFVPFPRNRFEVDELPLMIERLKIDLANLYRKQIKARTNTGYQVRAMILRTYIEIISDQFSIPDYTPQELADLEKLREQSNKKAHEIINRQTNEATA